VTKIKAVLFDYDGTLRDTKKLIYDSLEYAFQDHDLPAPTKEELAPHLHHHTFVHSALAPQVPQEDFEGSYRVKVNELMPGVRLFDGAAELLAELKGKGYKIVMVTAARHVTEDIARFGIAEYFDELVTANDIKHHKPDPEGINLAIERLGVNANEAIYIGDMQTDMYAAQAAKLRACVGVTIGFANRRELETAGADYIIDSLTELPALITKLEQ
jgi:HAD superfamily hydrolase (TIGR01509 family)